MDTLVPYAKGKNNIDAIAKEVKESQEGEMEVWVQEGKGHTVTVEMVKKTAEWVLTQALI